MTASSVTVDLLEQPRLGAMSALDWITAQLADPDVTDFHIVVAWARPSGLALLRAPLEAFRARGGVATIVTGLSGNSASIDGLRDALELFDEVSVAFDPTERTVHTKLYVAISPQTTRIAIGSQNITRGGLATNHELGVGLTFATAEATEERHPFVAQVLDYVRELTNDTALVHRLDEALLSRLAVSSQVEFTPTYKGAIPRKDAVFAASARAFRNDEVKPKRSHRPALVLPDAPRKWWQRLLRLKSARTSE